MANTPYPVAMPDDLLEEVRAAAAETGLSNADVIRQSVKLGLPKLREQFPEGGRVTNVEPLAADVAKRLYSQPDDDTESIRLFMAAQARGVEE